MRFLPVRLSRWLIGGLAIGCLAWAGAGASPASAATAKSVKPNKIGSLDCNHLSPVQRPVKLFLACMDLHDPSYSDDRFWDNGTYIGHDEPDLNFVSNAPGSGGNVSWTVTLPKDPAAMPTVATPGKDVTHYFELSPAIWFSMSICDSGSYPENPCTPNSDANAPSAECLSVAPCHGYLGAGSAFMELQLYPPGFGPWAVGPSFDDTHWGAALTIDSLEATPNFEKINNDCTEPVNFSFIQRNGVPPGPPSPQLSDLASSTPNSQTLLMNPGDTIQAHVFDAPAPGGGHALEAQIKDLTTGQSGFVQASAANGFMSTNVNTCAGTPYNFEPEYSTAKPTNISPWGAGTEVISASVEAGHFEPCTSLEGEALQQLTADFSDPFWSVCNGPYETNDGDGKDKVEPSDAPCYPAGDTHSWLGAGSPDEVTGCLDELVQNGDLDFDGTSYWPDWPDSTTPDTYPSTFGLQPPTTDGQAYGAYQFQTDIPFSELQTCSPETPSGCTALPPRAQFYPYWTLVSTPASGGPTCTFEFGNVQNGNTFGGDAQYGTFNTVEPVIFPDLASEFHPNTCAT
jgi:hypothetical protein